MYFIIFVLLVVIATLYRKEKTDRQFIPEFLWCGLVLGSVVLTLGISLGIASGKLFHFGVGIISLILFIWLILKDNAKFKIIKPSLLILVVTFLPFVLIILGFMVEVKYANGMGQVYWRDTSQQFTLQATITSTPQKIATKTRQPTADIMATFRSEVSLTEEAVREGYLSTQCYSWDQISLTDVGKTLCVYGIVKTARIDESQKAFFMIFGTEPSDFYMVTYDGWYWEDVQNQCVGAEGEIMEIGQAPVMVVDPYELYDCAE